VVNDGKPSGTRGVSSGAGMEAAPGESSCRKMSKSLVIRGEVEKGKFGSSKNNVSGDDNVVGGEIKTPVTFMVCGVSKENASGGSGCQFVSDFGEEIRIAGTTEHTQVLIGGADSMEGKVWIGRADRLGGEAVQQICDDVEPFYRVASQK
jgi:hypothetical protein